MGAFKAMPLPLSRKMERGRGQKGGGRYRAREGFDYSGHNMSKCLSFFWRKRPAV